MCIYIYIYHICASTSHVCAPPHMPATSQPTNMHANAQATAATAIFKI